MYPRNSASPQRVAIGTVVQISDGAVQTSGVTVRVLPFGGTEADGAGSTAYSTDGVVVYTPTQAETNYTSFVLIAKKTGCIPASITVVTSASDVAGYAGHDHSKIANATATVALTNTSIKSVIDAVSANMTQIAGQATSASAPVAFPASVANDATVAKDSTVAKDATVAKDSTVAKDATVAKEATLTNRPTLTQIEASTILAKEATVNTRASQASVDTLASYVDTEVLAIKAKTDNLPSDPADASDIASAFATVNSTLATIASYIDTEVAAIKAKTDNLPSDPADASDIAASFASVNAALTTITGYIDTEVAAIKAKTDNLPVDPADASDIAASFSNITTLLNTLASYVDTEVAAIKAKTDNLPSNPAATSDIPTANQNRDAILSASPDGWPDGSLGDRILISDNNNRTVKVTGAGAGHVAADVHAMQPDVLTASALAADAVTEIQNGLATSAALAAVAANVTALVTRIPATLFAGITSLGKWLGVLAGKTADATTRAEINLTPAGASYNETTDSLEAIRDRGDTAWITGTSQGTGARIVTITVRDSSANPIEAATVRVYRAGETYAGVTNASGVTSFSLDDATFTVAITAAGFSFTPVSLVVNANVSQTYTLTSTGGVTPSVAPRTTGYWTVNDLNGVAQAGAQVTIQASSPPSGSTGLVMEDAPRTATADNQGVVQFNNLVKGATYIVYRTGSSRKYNIVVPANAGDSVALGSIVG